MYRQRATVEYHRHGRFDGLMRRTLTATTALAVLPYTVGIMFASALFGWFFGPDWRDAGVLAQILLVGGFFAFVATPVDSAILIFRRTRYMVAWHFARLVFKLGAIATVAFMNLSVLALLWSIVLLRIALYLVDLVYSYHLARGNMLGTRYNSAPTASKGVSARGLPAIHPLCAMGRPWQGPL